MDYLSALLWTLSTVALALLFKWLIWRIPRRLPPGPNGLPLLGYLPFLSSSRFKDYIALGERYEKIFGFYLGSQYTVVLNDFADIKEAYNKDEFLDRPPNWFNIDQKSDNVLNMNGWAWKETRRFTLSTLRGLGMGKNKVEEAIKEEVGVFCEKLEKAGPQAEINVILDSYVHFLNVILTIICGRPYDDGEKLLDHMVDYGDQLINRVMDNLQNIYYPFLKPLMWIKTLIPALLKPSILEIKRFFKLEIEKHKENLNENNLDDFLSYYLAEIQKNQGRTTSILHENLLANAEILLFAATDTTRTTMTWTLLLLAQYPEYQEKIYQQIVDVLGKERPPQWSDKDALPLVDAFIMETSRYKTIAPAEDPHWSSKEGEIRGYCIPEGTMIIANIEAVHHDANLWWDPQNFRPWRFITAEGKAVAPEYWIPFLAGKRMCPGAKLAMMQLFLFVATVVQKFRIVPPKSGLSLEDKIHAMRFPAKPVVSFQKRD